jgi:multiple sugar transport system substrate-binding protein
MRRVILPVALATVAVTATACQGAGTVGGGGASCDGQIDGEQELSLFYHAGGEEKQAFMSIVEAFNASQDRVTVTVESVPEGTYNDAVQAAAASGELPDVLDFDGPNLYNYAWNGNLIPLDECLDRQTTTDLLPSIVEQGTYNDQLYGVGAFDSGMVLYAYRSALEEIGARIPQDTGDAWTAEEFTQILTDLRAAGYERPLDAHMWYGRQGEWFTYAFSPIVQSAGGDLIDRAGFQSADGVLNGPEAVGAMESFQSWFTEGYVETEAQDDSPFLRKRSPLAWMGMWMYPTYEEAAETADDELLVLPLPDFGSGSKTGMGSWQFGITSQAEEPDAAAAFLEHLLRTENLLTLSEAVAAPPATRAALAESELYGDGGPMSLVTANLERAPEVAVPRPQTPAYPAITQAFKRAVDDISQGRDVQEALDEAAARIDRDIEDNDGYPVQE